MKYTGNTSDLIKEGYTTNISNNYYYKTIQEGEKQATLFIDAKSKDISFEGNSIELGQKLVDAICVG